MAELLMQYVRPRENNTVDQQSSLCPFSSRNISNVLISSFESDAGTRLQRGDSKMFAASSGCRGLRLSTACKQACGASLSYKSPIKVRFKLLNPVIKILGVGSKNVEQQVLLFYNWWQSSPKKGLNEAPTCGLLPTALVLAFSESSDRIHCQYRDVHRICFEGTFSSCCLGPGGVNRSKKWTFRPRPRAMATTTNPSTNKQGF